MRVCPMKPRADHGEQRRRNALKVRSVCRRLTTAIYMRRRCSQEAHLWVSIANTTSCKYNRSARIPCARGSKRHRPVIDSPLGDLTLTPILPPTPSLPLPSSICLTSGSAARMEGRRRRLVAASPKVLALRLEALRSLEGFARLSPIRLSCTSHTGSNTIPV